MEVYASKDRVVGAARVRRALPQRTRRTVGAWCFADHLGPMSVEPESQGLGIGPHPHAGLATVTWLVEGSLLHKDSLGSEQPITAGQLNLMHAGHGIAHAEEQLSSGPRRATTMHGIQMWVAQPDLTRHGAAGFEHHGTLPQHEEPGGVATVLLGTLGAASSPARTDTPLLGAELVLQPGTTSTWGLTRAYEHALVVLSGSVVVDDGVALVPGAVGHLGTGRDELVLSALAGTEPTRLMLLGGEPFEAPIVMHWNYVGRSRAEMVEASEQWNAEDGRFGRVDSALARIPSPVPV